jgi:hypothetical protein
MNNLTLTGTLAATAAALLFSIYPNKGSLFSRMTRLSLGCILSLTGSLCWIYFLYGKLVG